MAFHFNPASRMRFPIRLFSIRRSRLYSSAAAAVAESPTPPHINPIKLRDYQEECITTCLQAFQNGVRRQLVSLPVASGKTTIFTNLISRIPPPTPKATKTLVLAHKTELIQQARLTLKRDFPHLIPDVEEGSKRAQDDADVIFASVNSLGRGGSTRLQEPRFDPSLYKAIVIDEAHHTAAVTYQRILKHFGADVPESPVLVWGCTATVRRHDGVTLKSAFDEIVFHRSIKQMMDEGWLCDATYHRLHSDVSLEDLPSTGPDFDIKKLRERVDVIRRNRAITEGWQEAYEKHGCKSTVIFAVDVQHIKHIQKEFEDNGVPVAVVYSDLKPLERATALESFRNGDVPVLINCGILTEGVDIPKIDCVILGRPTRSVGLLQQMIGRGLRTSPATGKTSCRIIDICDNVNAHTSLATVPTLLGLSRDFDFAGKSVRKVNEATERYRLAGYDLHQYANMEEIERVAQMYTYRTGVVFFSSPFLFDEVPKHEVFDTEAEEFRRMKTKMAWVRTGPASCALEVQKRKAVLVTQKNGPDGELLCDVTLEHLIEIASSYKHLHNPRKPRFFTKRTSLGTLDDFRLALHSAETYLRTHGLASPHIFRSAPWRREAPTNAQIEYLKKMRVENYDGWTKGKAADVLTKLRRGAREREEERKRGMEEMREEKERAKREKMMFERGGELH
ncbi:P-loop containing nucleoside triphosphate hydrolase protein [Fimicolochytrium jonesii]|uniref:P-loop containing nucleoside triphosphate hydrolase protein n=1 Tax=Fimicolochytrium jonesii TaxID=1396493 RepID=UPI0022FE188E|nr:P-loop containing nucleoside triphosphate hydrolase protein [Fimicolochytrium jonesii]KAI8819173.1 P-loop containing nucleoside triphosphate hydrolase protein [Fimicolochytrium jonesii]